MIVLATVAGAFGALTRYLLGGYVQQHSGSELPLGTFVVNMMGAFLLGVVVGIDDLGSALTMTAAGFLGGFTTFSTWMFETVSLGIAPLRLRALLNLGLSLLGGLVLAAAGYSLTH
jgi:fluoride exporter